MMQVAVFLGCLLMRFDLSEQKAAGRQIIVENQPYNMGESQNFEPPQQNFQPPQQNFQPPQQNFDKVLSSQQNANFVSQTQTESITVIQRRWMKAQSYCNSVTGRVAKFISKVEELVLGLPLAIIKAALGIPSDVVKLAISMAQSLLPKLERAKELLEVFFRTVFDLPAKALYGTISIFLDLVNKILDWGQTCNAKPVCGPAFPAIGGIGPCGGKWPCTQVMACQTTTCLQTSRALEVDGSSSQVATVDKLNVDFSTPKY